MNDYFNPSGAPSSKSSLSSSIMRSEITSIGAGFEKLPDLTGNNDLPIAINSGGSGIEAKTAAAFRTLIEVLSEDQITALITALDLGTASTNDTEDFATAAQGAKADAAATATSLSSHTGATGTSVHGLGTASTQASTAFATSAQGSKADAAAPLSTVTAHTGATGTSVHGLGSASTQSSTAFATAAQGTKADAAAPLSTVTAHTGATGTSVHGLGTASTLTAQTSTTDATSGRVLKVGAYGLGNGAAGTVAYGRGNILGTVSQLGGNPTGAILETGSNTNGTYFRYADGVQICYHSLSSASSPVWTYPKSFIATPFATGIAYDSSSPIVVTRGTVGSTSGGFKVWDAASGAVLISRPIDVIAIGRWF